MRPPGRAAAVALAVACTAQLAGAVTTVVLRWPSPRAAVDTLRVAAGPTSAPEVPLPTPSTVRSRVAHVVKSLSPPPLPLPSVTLPPVPLPTVTLPPVHLPPSPSACPDVDLAESPQVHTSYPVEASGRDTGQVLVAEGRAWFPEIARDGSFATSIVGVDLATGDESRTDDVPFFELGAVADGSAWGTANGALVRVDLASGGVAQRWSKDAFTTQTGNGDQAFAPIVVRADQDSAYVFGSGGRSAGVSRIDRSGKTVWTTALPASDAPWMASPSLDAVLAIGPGSVYVALPMSAHGQGVLRVWRLDDSGNVQAQRDVTAPGGESRAPGHLVVGPDGIYAALSVGGGDSVDGVVLRLDATTLAPTARRAVAVLEDLAAGPTGVWATSIQCNTFLWYHFDAGTLEPVGRPWSLPDQSYSLDASTSQVWGLRSRNPMEAVAVVGYRPG